MALTANYVLKYKGLSGTHPQLENSSIYDDGTIITTQGRKIACTTKTTTYVVADGIELVIGNAPATDFTVTLPVAAGTGRVITVKNINQGIVELTPDGTDTIDGKNLAAQVAKDGSCTVVDYAANKWVVIY